jgi:hypothetical protein
MPFMRNTISGTIVPNILEESQEYQHMLHERTANQPVWEIATTEQARAAGLLTAEGSVYALSAVVAAVTTVGADLVTNVGNTERAGTITKVEYFPASAQAGAATNSRTLKLFKDSTSGTLAASLALVSGVNLAAAVETDLTLSVTGSDLIVTAAELLVWQSLHVGTGIADPGGLVVVSYK